MTRIWDLSTQCVSLEVVEFREFWVSFVRWRYIIQGRARSYENNYLRLASKNISPLVTVNRSLPLYTPWPILS